MLIMKKKSIGLGLLIPGKMRVGGMTFYKRGGQVVGRVSESMEKRSNTLPQFVQRQRMRHTIALWRVLKYYDPMFTERGNAYQDFASLANRLPAVYVPKFRMTNAAFLMPGIPVSNGTLPQVRQELREVDGTAALLTDLKVNELYRGEKLRLYTAVQYNEYDMPWVRFEMREVSRREMTAVDGCLAIVGEEFADEMKGWALVRIIGDSCSPQTIVTRCTLYQQYTTDEALQAAAKSYGGLTKPPFPSPR